MQAKKKYGQNFLINSSIINNIINEVDASLNDLIIEIGPGRGALTRLLKEKNANIIAYEIDEDLKRFLNPLEDNKTRILYKDILSSNINEDIKNIKYDKLFLVGNLPYYITTPIIEHIIKSNITFDKLIIMVQKEVAERFMADVGNKERGYFTLYINHYFNIKKICFVDKSSFNPIPKVDSMVISLICKDNNLKIDIEKYFSFLKECFKQKRKTLKNNLNNYDWNIINNILKKYNLDEKVRAEDIKEEIFIEIFKKIK